MLPTKLVVAVFRGKIASVRAQPGEKRLGPEMSGADASVPTSRRLQQPTCTAGRTNIEARAANLAFGRG